MLILALAPLVLWLIVLALPWRPWRCAERVEPAVDGYIRVDGVTVLIPARDEAAVIGTTLRAIATAAPASPVIVVDDQSSDATAAIARAGNIANLTLIRATPPPPGWTGKLWALQQGFALVRTPRVLLLDADIRLAPGMLAALQRKADEGHALVSACAEPCWDDLAARWLLPAFVYFFKLLYPFALANRRASRVAAAAGGVVLADVAALRHAGGFAAWRGAIIDDCTLAAHIKRAGHRTFIGLTHGAQSLRRAGLGDVAHMVARTAFVQLRESWWLLAAVSVLMGVAFWLPVVAALSGGGWTRAAGVAGWLALAACYVPTLAYYRRNRLAAAALPLVATLFLAMTWHSALRTLTGTRSVWKGRRYQRKVA